MFVFKKSKAFTFAELALVLIVIGIVSMLTVPALRKFIFRSQFERGAQKAYFTLNEAYDEAVLLYGPPHKWETGKAGSYIQEQLKLQENGLTADGMEIQISCTDENCEFIADVNGPKKEPNEAGRDIFEYKLSFGKVDPKENEKGELPDVGEVDITERVIPQETAYELMQNNWKYTDDLWNDPTGSN